MELFCYLPFPCSVLIFEKQAGSSIPVKITRIYVFHQKTFTARTGIEAAEGLTSDFAFICARIRSFHPSKPYFSHTNSKETFRHISHFSIYTELFGLLNSFCLPLALWAVLLKPFARAGVHFCKDTQEHKETTIWRPLHVCP